LIKEAREFISTPVYDRLWNDLGLTDDDLTQEQKKQLKALIKTLKGE